MESILLYKNYKLIFLISLIFLLFSKEAFGSASCFSVTANLFIREKPSISSKKLGLIKKSSSICINFPKPLNNSDADIFLDEFKMPFSPITILELEDFKSGYIDSRFLKKVDIATSIKVTKKQPDSSSLPTLKGEKLNILGVKNINHILNLVKNFINSGDLYSAKNYLALAQDIDSLNPFIYILYARILRDEGSKEEGLKLLKEVNKTLHNKEILKLINNF